MPSHHTRNLPPPLNAVQSWHKCHHQSKTTRTMAPSICSFYMQLLYVFDNNISVRPTRVWRLLKSIVGAHVPCSSRGVLSTTVERNSRTSDCAPTSRVVGTKESNRRVECRGFEKKQRDRGRSDVFSKSKGVVFIFCDKVLLLLLIISIVAYYVYYQ